MLRFISFYIMFQANLVVDGWQDHTFGLDHPFSAIKPRHISSQLHPHLFIGHTVKDTALNRKGTWSLGSFMLLKGLSIFISKTMRPTTYIWASLTRKLSWQFRIKEDSYQSAKIIQRLARIFFIWSKFACNTVCITSQTSYVFSFH